MTLDMSTLHTNAIPTKSTLTLETATKTSTSASTSKTKIISKITTPFTTTKNISKSTSTLTSKITSISSNKNIVKTTTESITTITPKPSVLTIEPKAKTTSSTTFELPPGSGKSIVNAPNKSTTLRKSDKLPTTKVFKTEKTQTQGVTRKTTTTARITKATKLQTLSAIKTSPLGALTTNSKQLEYQFPSSTSVSSLLSNTTTIFITKQQTEEITQQESKTTQKSEVALTSTSKSTLSMTSFTTIGRRINDRNMRNASFLELAPRKLDEMNEYSSKSSIESEPPKKEIKFENVYNEVSSNFNVIPVLFSIHFTFFTTIYNC